MIILVWLFWLIQCIKKKLLQLLLHSIVMQVIQIFYGARGRGSSHVHCSDLIFVDSYVE